MSAEKVIELSKTGYAGVNKQGQIVDRREFPNAVPMPANTMFGVPAPLFVSENPLTKCHADLQAEKRTQNIVNEPVIVDDKNKWIDQPDSEGWYWYKREYVLFKSSNTLYAYQVIIWQETPRVYNGGNLVDCKHMKGRWMKMQHVPEV